MANKNSTPNHPEKNDILNRFGGVIKNSLQTTFGPLHDDDTQYSHHRKVSDTVSAIPVYPKSEFLIPEDAEQYLKDNKNNFTVFSLNVDSMCESMRHYTRLRMTFTRDRLVSK